MNKPKLYTTPFIVAWIMLIIGLLAAFNPAYMPLISEDFSGLDGGFAFMMIGIFVAITAIIIFCVYGKLNRDFDRMLAGDSLLTYIMPFDLYQYFSQKQAEDIKANNKTVLFTILGFCVLFGIILGIAVDTLYIIICLCIAVFFTIVFFLTTSFRTRKVKKSKSLVCLNGGGAFIFGEMNSWSSPGTWLNSVDFLDGAASGLPCPAIQITYTALSGTIPQVLTVTIPVPQQLISQGQWAFNTLKNIYRI